jgi:hypothetical protein
MKKIILFLSAITAIFVLSSFCIVDAKQNLDTKSVPEKKELSYSTKTSEEAQFFEIFFEDLSDDDNSKDSEQEKVSPKTTPFCYAPTLALFNYFFNLKRKNYHQFSFPFCLSVFILICILRI